VPTGTIPNDPPWWDSWRGVIFANARVFQAVERSLQEHAGLTLSFLDVMGRLYDAPERRLRMQELQERSLFTHSGMTRLIDRIEAAGFVGREPVPGDRRGVFVVLTPEGGRAYEAGIAQHRSDVQREYGNRLTTAEHRAVSDALSQFWHD
jgi:DNA-binding MarR family transcriptional regulator